MDRVSNEVTPRVTLAGAASGFIQNDTHCVQLSARIVGTGKRVTASDHCANFASTHRHDDDQARWDVGVEQVITETSLQHEYNLEAGEVTW